MTSTNSSQEILYFDPIKEDRGTYLVEYKPPVSRSPFSTLTLLYLENHELSSVAENVKAEVVRWLARYPVPIMAWAYDAAENSIRPHGDVDDGFLVGWYEPGTSTFSYAWKLEGLPQFLNDTNNLPDWRSIYKDVTFRTDAQVKANAKRHLSDTRKNLFTLKIMLVLWLAAIPAVWAIIQFLGPGWLATAVLLYALWKAIHVARNTSGHWV